MKGYLSRLVARAQSPASPAAIAPRPAPGPLAESPFEPPPPSAPHLAAPIMPVVSALSRAAITRPAGAPGLDSAPAPPPPLAPTTNSSTLLRPAAPIAREPAPRESALMPVAIVPPASRRPERIATPPIESAKEILRPPASPIPPSDASAFREVIPTRPIAAEPNAPDNLSPPSGTPVPASSPAPSPAAGQARLQRLADMFMARLSPRAESVLAAISALPQPAPAATSPDSFSPPAATRLQPVAPAPAQPPPPPAPSVVIGRLSVEVVPPAAPARLAPAAPRAARRRAVARPLPAPRSSARFGLGQL